MNEIVRSRNAMLLAALGGALAALGEVMGVIAFAVLSLNNAGTFTDLGHAHDWLFFGGSLFALGAVALVTWERIVQNQGTAGVPGPETLELFGATIATLFIAIGSLVLATSNGTSSGNTLAAVGIGLWGLLALTRAARHNRSDRPATGGKASLTAVWLGVAVGLIVLAVGYGFSFGTSSQASSMASGIIGAVGVGIWAGAVVVARNNGFLTSPLVGRVITALGLALAAFVAEAVVAGVVFGSSGTITGLRIGGAIIELLLALSIATFGYAAWLRAAELPVSVRPSSAPAGPITTSQSATSEADPDPADQSTSAPPTGGSCSSCGGALPEGAPSCPSCGAPVTSGH